MIEMPITLEPYESYCNRLIEETHKIVKEMHDIVHCKDCKYCDRHHLVDGLFCYRLYEKYNREYPQMIIEITADDFCSRGDKR